MSEHEHDWPQELKLDDHAGPAAHLSSSARDALLDAVLAQAYPAPVRKPWLSMAAAVLLACLGGGSASAAVLWYVRSRGASEEVLPPKRAVSASEPPAAAQIEPAAEPAAEPVLEPTPTKAARAIAAEDWFREGNRLRSARRWKQADDAYGQAAQHATNDESAYVAYVASAGVRLEHLHDARGALSRYRAALRASAHGALDEEIRLGIADAYRALGDTKREAEALELLLRDHPHSPLAEQARNRLH